MSSIVDTVVNFEGREAGFFLKPLIEEPTLQQLGWEIITGQSDKWLYMHTSLGKITKAKTGCGSTDNTDGVAISRKKLEANELEAYKEICYTVFNNTFLAEARKVGTDRADLTGTDIEDILRSIFGEAVFRDMLRIMLLGDSALASTDYNQLDGWVKKITAGIAASDIQHIGAIANTDIDTDAETLALFREIYNSQGRRLKTTAAKEKAFYVTRSVFEAYQGALLANENLESARAELINGNVPTTYMGIEVLPLDIIDEFLDADFKTGSPLAVAKPHRVVLSEKKNNVLYIDQESFTDAEIWYDRNSQKNKFRASYILDVQYKYGEMMVTAGF
jgi:hypothetical protein